LRKTVRRPERWLTQIEAFSSYLPSFWLQCPTRYDPRLPSRRGSLYLIGTKLISLTPKAAEKIREIQQEENLGDQGLRLRVLGGGCAGFQYDLYFEDNITPMDEEYESHGIKLYVDMISFQYLEGVTVDYTESLMGAGFKFLNPKAKSTCGCGSSFSA